MSKEKKTISFVTNFYNNHKQLHTQKCDYKIKGTRLDFDTCPIIAEIHASGIKPDFNIDSIVSVDVVLNVPKACLPKSLLDAVKICKNCELKHREREA